MKYLIITDKNKGVCSNNTADTMEQALIIQAKQKALYNGRSVITDNIGLGASLATVDYDTGVITWNYDKNTADKLAVAKTDKLQAISTRAKTELDKGYTVDGQTYSISNESISLMQTKANEAVNHTWTSKGYVKHDFGTWEAFGLFLTDCYNRSEAITQNKLRLKGLVTQASDVTVLEAIDITGGW